MSFGKFLHEVATSFREDRIEKDAETFASVMRDNRNMVEAEERVNRWGGALLSTSVAATLINILGKEASGHATNAAELYYLGLGSMVSYRLLVYSKYLRGILDQNKKA